MKTQNIIPLISLGNEGPRILTDHNQLVPGAIALANESRLTTSTFSEGLTNYIVGWKDTEDPQVTVDYATGRPVPVARRFEFKKAKNSEAFLSELDDERAIGAPFKRVEYRGETVLGKTKNRGLTLRLDRDEISGVMDEERAAALLLQRIKRNKLRRVITALLGLAHNNPVTWGTGSNPQGDMRDAIAAGQLASGVFPNRGLIGLTAWNLRASVMEAGDKAGDFAGAARTPREVAASLGLEDLRTLASLYQSSVSGKTRILESLAVFFYASDMMDKDEPSNLKQFVSNTDSGGIYAVHREEIGAKFVDVTVEHYDDIVGTSTIGAEKLTITPGS